MGIYKGPYSKEGGMGKLNTKQDYSRTAGKHDISTEEFKRACNPWDEPTWKPGPVKKGS